MGAEYQMGLTMRERRSVVRVTADRYRKAGRREKRTILDELIEATEYNRRYASWLLREHGKATWVGRGLKLIGYVSQKQERRGRPKYNGRVVEALKRIWAIMDFICGKRLAAAMKEVVPILEGNKEIRLDKQTRDKLMTISAATIDRVLAPERKKYQLRGRSGTKPGTLLKNKIQIRTFAQWDEQKPGFVEIDLVGHDGGNTRGDYCQTLNVTDVQTGWTEARAVKNKAQVWVFEAIEQIRKQMPFEMVGIDSDNGSEFINEHLVKYCEKKKITFTRARASRKNDNCYVEQKNYTVVRRMVGYARRDTPEELETLNELYSHLRLYSNYFQPVMKLKEKERIGSKVIKRYDKPITPYQRVQNSPDVSMAVKRGMKRQYSTLNPAELKRQIDRLQGKLLRLSGQKSKGRPS
jgi:hypothetical protein